MCKRNNSALFFTCSLIEQIGRMLHARRGDVAAGLGEKGVQAIYDYADVLHCDPIEKAADDTIAEFSLQGGSFDNVSAARYAPGSMKSSPIIIPRSIMNPGTILRSAGSRA